MVPSLIFAIKFEKNQQRTFIFTTKQAESWPDTDCLVLIGQLDGVGVVEGLNDAGRGPVEVLKSI